MATIQELIDEHGAGVKVAHTSYKKGRYFIPCGTYVGDICARWMGVDEDGELETGPIASNDCWSLYQEPVEMEDRWLWYMPYPNQPTQEFYAEPKYPDWVKIEGSKVTIPKEKK